jgi:hypothetical protein
MDNYNIYYKVVHIIDLGYCTPYKEESDWEFVGLIKCNQGKFSHVIKSAKTLLKKNVTPSPIKNIYKDATGVIYMGKFKNKTVERDFQWFVSGDIYPFDYED